MAKLRMIRRRRPAPRQVAIADLVPNRLAFAIRAALAALLLALLCACAGAGKTRQAALPAVQAPVHTVTERRVYVPVPAHLTETRPIPVGPLADAPLVAKQRGALLQACFANLEAIAGIQGTPVAPGTSPLAPEHRPKDPPR